MAILFFILRLIGWVLLAILLLLVVALLLPLGIQAAYRPGEAFAKAFYGPLKFTLWPRGGTQGAQSKAKSKPTQKSPEKPDTSPPPTVIKTVEGDLTLNKEGYYTNMKMTMDMDMTMQGETIGLKMEMTAEVHDPGKTVEVTLPDTEGYQEIDPSLLNVG